MRRQRPIGSGFAFAVLGALALVVTLIASLCQGPRESALPSAASAPAREEFPNAWPAPPPADVAALLGGLGPDAMLTERWRVRGVSPVIHRKITVDVERGDVGFRVWVMKHDADPRKPPASTAHYALYSAQPRPHADSIDDEARDQVLSALAHRIKQTENVVPAPAGM